MVFLCFAYRFTRLRRKVFLVRNYLSDPFPKRRKGQTNKSHWTIIWQSPKSSLVEEEWVRNLFLDVETQDLYDVENGLPKYSIVKEKAIIVIAASDNREYKKINDYIKQFKGIDFILVHLSDEGLKHKTNYYKYAPLVLRQYYSADANRKNVRVIPLGHISGMNIDTEQTNRERKYIWSFAGEVSHHKPHRFKMIESLKDYSPNYYFLTDDFGKSIKQGLKPEEYSELLSNSYFVPSPMGNCNLDCFRIYESLSMGAIPIVVGSKFKFYKNLSYLKSPIIRKSNWREVVELISSLISDSENLADIQKKHIDWWQSSVKTLRSEIKNWCQN